MLRDARQRVSCQLVPDPNTISKFSFFPFSCFSVQIARRLPFNDSVRFSEADRELAARPLFCECTHLWSVVDFRRLLQRKPWADEAIGSSLQDIAKPAGLIATAVRDFQLSQRSFSPASAERSASRTPLDELYHFLKIKPFE